jgi:hypothetical protein
VSHASVRLEQVDGEPAVLARVGRVDQHGPSSVLTAYGRARDKEVLERLEASGGLCLPTCKQIRPRGARLQVDLSPDQLLGSDDGDRGVARSL